MFKNQESGLPSSIYALYPCSSMSNLPPPLQPVFFFSTFAADAMCFRGSPLPNGHTGRQDGRSFPLIPSHVPGEKLPRPGVNLTLLCMPSPGNSYSTGQTTLFPSTKPIGACHPPKCRLLMNSSPFWMQECTRSRKTRGLPERSPQSLIHPFGLTNTTLRHGISMLATHNGTHWSKETMPSW